MNKNKRITSVAPMLDWTDRHCRYFHRLITRHTWLYTEMVTTGALIYGDVDRHLNFNEEEHPVALQLGGSDTADLAKCAKLGQQWGYDEINLNCGCPSPRVQKGAFGACLMGQSSLVSDCVKAMQDAVDIDVTVKHRIGLDKVISYEFVRDFMGEIAATGCKTFIVHARNAILGGISPKANREIPPLRYDIVYQLKQDFPDLEIILNGQVETVDDIQTHLSHVDGVMIGRAAYHYPYRMAEYDRLFYGDDAPVLSRKAVAEKMIDYMDGQLALYGDKGLKLHGMMRHILGLMSGVDGAKRFRQILSDPNKLASGKGEIIMQALAAVADGA